MQAATIPIDEKVSPAASRKRSVLDTPADERFDRFTRLACGIAHVPIALIGLADRERQWIKSQHGLDATELGPEYLFYAPAMHEEDVCVVRDCRADLRFADNPLVTGAPHIRFYAAHAIHAPDGTRIGALCVIDTQPRTLDERQLRNLSDLALMTEAMLLKSRLSMATNAAQIGVYERSRNLHDVWWSEVMWEIFGQNPATFQLTWPSWLSLVHGDDRERVKETAGNTERARTALSIQYRIVRPDGSIRHVQSIGSTTKPQGDDDIRSLTGILLDVTARVQGEERDLAAQLLLREQSHQAGKAEVASGVLHHVGNVLNSLGIANNTARRDLKAIRPARLQSASAIIVEKREALAAFLTDDTQGRNMPNYLAAFAGQLVSNVQSVETELEACDKLLEQLRDIIGAQTAFSKIESQFEALNLEDLVESALKGQEQELVHIAIVRDYTKLPLVSTNRHKLLQIVLSLIDNACEAIQSGDYQRPEIIVRLYSDKDHVILSIKDSGVGLSKEAMYDLWRASYTTQRKGQGFGLHDSANAARDIGVQISADSEGPGKGSCFTIRIPKNTGDGSKLVSDVPAVTR